MIGDILAALNIAMDRFEESHRAVLIAGERLGTEAMATEESVYYALVQAEECSEGGKAASDLVFRSGPDVTAGQRIMQAAVDAEQRIQELRLLVNDAHAQIDAISHFLIAARTIAGVYRDRLTAAAE